ncbi:MAG: hypothetical protein ABF379_08155 [Akkermansiaceae bacterium]
MKRLFTSLALAVFLIGLSACRESQSAASDINKPVTEFPADAERIKIIVTGMT